MRRQRRCDITDSQTPDNPAHSAHSAHAHQGNHEKTFHLHVEGKHPDRLLEAIKHEIRKYIKREQNKARPEGVDFWDFDCRFGSSEATAAVIEFADITGRINAFATDKADAFYLELLAKPGVKKPRPVAAPPAPAEEG